MGEQGMMLDPGYTDWPDGGGHTIDTYGPPRRFWAILALSGVFMWASFAVHDAFFGLFLISFMGNLYSTHSYQEDQKTRNRTIDILENL